MTMTTGVQVHPSKEIVLLANEAFNFTSSNWNIPRKFIYLLDGPADIDLSFSCPFINISKCSSEDTFNVTHSTDMRSIILYPLYPQQTLLVNQVGYLNIVVVLVVYGNDREKFISEHMTRNNHFMISIM